MSKAERERIRNEQARINKYNTIKNNLPKSIKIDELELKKLKDSNRGNCIICLSDCEINDEAINLPCSHLFHEDCIIKWFSYNNKCPLCKKAYNYTNDNNGNNEDHLFSFFNISVIIWINYNDNYNISNDISMTERNYNSDSPFNNIYNNTKI